jgi:type I restriction enzyme M protein
MAEGRKLDAAEYEDIPGFCKSAPLDEICKHGFVLTPGRYVGAEAQEADAEPFDARMFEKNLNRLGYGG